MENGIDYIIQERARQQSEEGYTLERDRINYLQGQLGMAAAAYATPAHQRIYINKKDKPYCYPFGAEYWKPTPEDRIRELTKAGALIAAEIDRLLYEEKRSKDREVFDKLHAIYHKFSYIIAGGKPTEEECAWLDNNTFKCVVTPETARNGYNGDKAYLLKHLDIGEEYTLDSMSVGQSSSTLTLKEFPGKPFNTVNFKIHIDNEKRG